MAQDSPIPGRTNELIAAIARNREELAAHRAGLRHAARPADHIKRTLHQHAALFFGSAAALGLLLSLIPSRRRDKEGTHRQKKAEAAASLAAAKDRKNTKRSLAAIALGIAGKAALEMGKPIVLKMIREHLAARQHGRLAPSSPATPARTL